MKRAIYILLIFIAYTGFSQKASAQKFTAAASSTEVSAGEVFQVEWSLEGNGSGFQLPSMPDFEIAGGPQQGSSMSIINGHVSQSISITYAFRAKKAGTFKIPPATIRTGSGNVQSNPLTIKVVQGSAKGGGGSSPRGGGSQGGGNADAEYFIEATVDRTNVYEGEPLTVTYKLYLRNTQPQNINPKKAPSFTGFWTKDLPDAVDKELRPEERNGKRYGVAVIKKAILYPQHPGTLTIDPIEWEVALAMRAPKKRSNNPWGMDDPFEDFFGSQVEIYHKTLTSNTIPIHVNPVPEAGKPANFNGLVGSFSVHANVDKTKVKENDAITYRITVEGQGNLQQVQAFTLNLPPDWDVYDPKTIDKPGGKTFEYTIIPKKMGKYTLPAVDFSFFDLATRRYHTDKTKEFEIEVLKGNGAPSGPSNMSSKEDVKLLGQDIRFIKTRSGNLSRENNTFYNSGFFWALGLFPFLLFGLMLFMRRKNDESTADVAGTLRRNATGMARKRLKTAKAFMDKGDKKGFYDQILLGLYGYIQNKIGLQLAETSRDTIRLALAQHHAKDEEINRFVELVDTCELAKYASSVAPDNLNEVYNRSVELISNLEGQLK